LIENLPAIIKGIVDAIPEIIQALVDAFASYFGKLGEVGFNLIKGLWEGISNAASWIMEKIKGFCGGIVDGIKDFFGIQSPSKVFAGIGGYMAEGLGEGFADEMDDVTKRINNSIPTSLDMPSINQAEIAQQQTADMINAFGTLTAGMRSGGGVGDGGNAEVVFKIDSAVFARALLPAYRQISGQLPEITPDF
jgi:phage-related protein